jgi:hypothetical protein
VTHHTITRTHRAGPDVVVLTDEPVDLSIAPPPRAAPHWTDPAPVRDDPPNPWTVRLLTVAALLVLLAFTGVLLWR